MPAKPTNELEERQNAALAKNADRKRIVKELTESNGRLQERVAELEAGNGNVAAIRLELNKSNELLEQLQDAVLSDD